MLSFEVPFLMESTSPRLLQKNCTFFQFNNLPQIEQLKTMDTSSLAIMVVGVHSGSSGTGTIGLQIMLHSPMY